MREIPTTTTCPLCGEVVHGVVNKITRTDILMGHLVQKHSSAWRPEEPRRGPPLPKGLGIKWPRR